MILLLLACGGGDEVAEGRPDWRAFAGAPGLLCTFVPQGAPESAPALLLVAEEAWEVRAGEDWDSATPVVTWTREADDGLVVEGTVLLPASMESGPGVTVAEIGEATVWYGTFPKAATVTVAEGVFAGESVFAEEVGPVSLSVDGAVWELASYVPATGP